MIQYRTDEDGKIVKTVSRIILVVILLSALLIISSGCAVMHSKTRGTETKTQIKTHTDGYLLIVPLWSNDTVINKRTDEDK